VRNSTLTTLLTRGTVLALAILTLAITTPHQALGSEKKVRRSALKSMSAPRVLRTLDLGDFGSHVVKFGRLSPDGQAGVVFVQIDSTRNITCITAVSLADGAVIWQRGTPNAKNFETSGEIPVQVYDWNQDGIDDVIFYENGNIVVSHGSDGSTLANVAAPEPYSLFIYQTTRFGGPAGLVLHGRTFTSLLAPDLTTAWSYPNGFSHFPMAVDVNSDGDPELLAGYLLFNSAGEVLWDRGDLGAHNDASDFADANCDGVPEIAIATSKKSTLVTTTGESLWHGVEFHAQHITVGNFIPGICEKQIAVIDRDKAKSGFLRLYDHTGKMLWERGGHGNRAMMSRIDDWIAGVPQSLILVFRTPQAPPTLYDGQGRIVARLPFPPSLKKRKGKSFYTFYFVQHFDYDGDGQEEIFVSNERALWIYSNSLLGLSSETVKAPQTLPNPRIFNSTFYIGGQ
jgi:hypothetical protein